MDETFVLSFIGFLTSRTQVVVEYRAGAMLSGCPPEQENYDGASAIEIQTSK